MFMSMFGDGFYLTQMTLPVASPQLTAKTGKNESNFYHSNSITTRNNNNNNNTKQRKSIQEKEEEEEEEETNTTNTNTNATMLRRQRNL